VEQKCLPWELTPVLMEFVRIDQSLVFYVVFSWSLFVLFFFWSWYCLSFFDLLFLITSLWYLHFLLFQNRVVCLIENWFEHDVSLKLLMHFKPIKEEFEDTKGVIRIHCVRKEAIKHLFYPILTKCTRICFIFLQ
jgi:hypothetical protein